MKFIPYLFCILFLYSCSPKESSQAENSEVDSIAKKLYDSSFVYLEEQNNPRKAFINLSKAKDLYHQQDDDFNVAKCIVNMAIIQERESDNLGSIESSLSALHLLDKNNPKHYTFLYSNYNNLGVASNTLKNFQDAEKYYRLALKFSKDSLDTLMIKNNLGASYHSQEKYGKAAEVYKGILNNLSKKDDVYYKIATNYARSETIVNSNFNAEAVFREALNFYKKNDDQWGLDAVYCNFSEYYIDKNVDSTKWYAKKMLDIAQKLKAPTDQLQALDFLIKVENNTNSKKYYQQFKKLSDSIDLIQNSSKNQFALIRFESEKNKADKLKLEKDLQQKEYMLYSGLFLLFTSVFGGYYWYGKRKTRIELKAQNQIKEERLITSKKVHDVVANGLYQVMSGLEHADIIDKEDVLDQLDGMYQKSRDISYDNFNFPIFICFKDKFSELTNSFQRDDVNIFVVGNDEALWQNIPEGFNNDLYLIVRELLVNMKKHSQANRVVIKFEKEEEIFKLTYKDNGIGDEFPKEKNGLKSIKERVKKYQGIIEINGAEGYAVKMHFNL